MPRRPSKKSRQPAQPESASPARAWRGVLLAGLAAVYVAQPLLPSEGVADSGDGLSYVMLLLTAAAAWLLLNVRGPERRFRVGWVDVFWMLFIVCVGASAVSSGGQPTTRASLNMFWQWTTFGLGFWLWRQLLWTERERRACIVVMLGLAVAISGMGLYQSRVTMPEVRLQYKRDPDESLRAAGVVAPPGSPERQRFEDRLASVEPTASFALANSLAGFLTAWLVVAVGLTLVQSPALPHGGRAVTGPAAWLGALLVALPLALCLVLTKSRSAYGGCALGLLATAWICRGGGRRALAKVLVALTSILGVLVAIAWRWGAVDRELVSESFKSLTYRWQYWQASLAIVRDHPWLGCGPGNFQDFYTRFKLAEASEVVADPHSMVFEVWSTLGTPAALALLAVLACCFRRDKAGEGTPREEQGADEASPIVQPSPVARDSSTFVLAGGVAGFALALLIGQISVVSISFGACVWGVAALSLTWWLLHRWLVGGELPRALPRLAAAALAINLLAAGGIGFPGVAGSFWLLLAISLSWRPQTTATSTWPVATGLAGALVLLMGCYLTAYRPVMACSAAILEAHASFSQSERLLLEAAEADPWSDLPWRELAERQWAIWKQRRSDQGLRKWERYVAQVHARRPNSSAAWRNAGDIWLEVWSITQDRRSLEQAIAAYETAIRLYPNHATSHALLAIALRSAGEKGRAADEVRQALDLDRRTPHSDQKLPAALRASLEKAGNK